MYDGNAREREREAWRRRNLGGEKCKKIFFTDNGGEGGGGGAHTNSHPRLDFPTQPPEFLIDFGRAQFGGLVTANFAIVFSGTAIRRARRELVNIQGGTIALLEDCNSSLAFPPPSLPPLSFLPSMKRCVKNESNSVVKPWDKDRTR